MALEGTIRDFGLPDIFQLIGLQRKTGLLTLTHEKGEIVTVAFENGMVVMADSSLRRLEDRIGNVLVKQGKITRDRLDEALATQRQTLQRLGHILLSSGAITNKDLREALQIQVSQIVFRVFRWRDGSYLFAPSEAVDFDRENFAPMSTDFILMEGIRMVDEWPIIEKKISSFDLVFRTVVDPGLIDVVSSGDGGSEKRSAGAATGRIRLSAEEERVFRRIDGSRTVQAIVDATGIGEFDVCRTLFDFLNRNLIALAGHGEARAAQVEQEGARRVVPGYVLALALAAIGALGVLLHAGAPFAVSGLPPVLSQSQELLRDSLMRDRLQRLDTAIGAWRARDGRLPETLEDLARAGLIDRSYLLDPWRRPFHYEPDAGGYLLSAVDEQGRNRADATLDRRPER